MPSTVTAPFMSRNPLPLMRVPRGVAVNERGHARSPGLLQLEEEHVLRAVALQQHNERSQSHTPHADYLMGHVND